MLLPDNVAGTGELTAGQRQESRRFPIAVVNLLRKGSIERDRSEAKLYAAYCDLLTALQKEGGLHIICLLYTSPSPRD